MSRIKTDRASEENRSGSTQGGIEEIGAELRSLLADAFALFVKTKNFHWHMSGPHFRDYHLLLDEQADQVFAITDEIAERARKLGEPALRSIGDIARRQRLQDDDRNVVGPDEMLVQLRADNKLFTGYLRTAHDVCEQHRDVATTSLVEVWIDQAERRSWFLAETISATETAATR